MTLTQSTLAGPRFPVQISCRGFR